MSEKPEIKEEYLDLVKKNYLPLQISPFSPTLNSSDDMMHGHASLLVLNLLLTNDTHRDRNCTTT
jgi:hypothetical protein